MSYTIFDFIGNIGVVLIVLSFLLLQAGKIESLSVGYSVSNALGAVLILVSLWTSFNWSAFIIEIFWLLISLYGLYRGFAKKSRSARSTRRSRRGRTAGGTGSASSSDRWRYDERARP